MKDISLILKEKILLSFFVAFILDGRKNKGKTQEKVFANSGFCPTKNK